MDAEPAPEAARPKLARDAGHRDAFTGAALCNDAEVSFRRRGPRYGANGLTPASRNRKAKVSARSL